MVYYLGDPVFFSLPVSLEVSRVGLLGICSGLIVRLGEKVVGVKCFLRSDVSDGGVGMGSRWSGYVVRSLFVIVILLVIKSFPTLAGMYFPQHLNSIYSLMEIRQHNRLGNQCVDMHIKQRICI
jgi:hypothetical protein